MMVNLFSVFDPSTTWNGLSLNWVSTFLGVLLMPLMFWFHPSRSLYLWKTIISSLHQEFKVLTGPSTGSLGATLVFVALFSMILFNNSLGLFPHIFTSTSHLALTLSLALPLWVGFMLYGWINYTFHMFSHLVPQGTPSVLTPFMVCIETVSNLIRPGTLAVRLAANMIAGHLLLTLLGNMGPSVGGIVVGGLLGLQVALLTLEAAVAVIQSYVFAVLSTLYSSEVS
uniref:ATP synthase F0 subunit 6 n=1 Tax=Apachyus feae TaxID=2914707 RepID=UPI001EF9D589|nr:ATP synthase F0 subunit 6 [Apachyus feae]UKE80565.1 ATP synthase F0 subunit 6 [Apachyus feae]